MTFEKLKTIIEKNNINPSVELLSDSGWECSATEMDGVYYNESENCIVFTQECNEYSRYHNRPDWRALNEGEAKGEDNK